MDGMDGWMDGMVGSRGKVGSLEIMTPSGWKMIVMRWNIDVTIPGAWKVEMEKEVQSAAHT